MRGRHQVRPGRRALLGWVAALAAVLVAGATILGFSSAAGAATTVKAQLTLSGLADGNNPIGGSRIGIHPGDTVQITPSTAPTAGLDKLGLGDLVSGVLDGLAGFQVTADFSHLPGGHAKTVIKTKTKPISFTFKNEGTYNFTWSAQQITLLGVVPLPLNFNQLAKAGIKLNASNQYVGQIVVAKNPPKGGLGLQLPSVGVHPSLPVVGQLPSVGIPGVKVTVPVDVPDLNPTKSSGSSGGSGGGGPKTGSSSSKPAQPIGNVIPVPARVVPLGDGAGVFGDSGGYQANALPGSQSDLGTDSGLAGPSSAGGKSGAKASGGPDQKSTGKDKTIDLASSTGTSTGQLSVILAIVAVIVLSLVSALYARLYLLRRNLS